ncbi:MAG: MlaD family protein [Chitinophagales bacterium]|nr:MlaD family protein [Chitinophagales bacterium]
MAVKGEVLKYRSEVAVGAFTLIAITLMILGYSFLQGNNVFSKSNYIQINFENTTGLFPTNSVTINGLEVGRIKDIHLANDGKNQVIVRISLPSDMQIPEDSKFAIESVDLLGKKVISIVKGTSSILANEKTIYQGINSPDMFESISGELSPLTEKLNKLLVSVDTMINDVHSALGYGENSKLKIAVESATATLENANKVLAEVSEVFSSQSNHIKHLIQGADSTVYNASVITKKIADNSQSIDHIIKNFDTLSYKLAQADIEKTIASTTKVMEEVNQLLASINQGEGTLGRIVKDEEMYKSIDKTIKSLNTLLEDLKANPKRYVSFSLIERKNKE